MRYAKLLLLQPRLLPLLQSVRDFFYLLAIKSSVDCHEYIDSDNVVVHPSAGFSVGSDGEDSSLALGHSRVEETISSQDISTAGEEALLRTIKKILNGPGKLVFSY